MAVDKTEADNPFASLVSHQFVLLKTFRKSGVAVPTVVWFAPDANKLYVMTTAGTGKMKRIRNNGRVLLTPSDRSGKALTSEEVEGQAHELSISEHVHASAVLANKYGFMYRMFMLFGRLSRTTRTYIEISSS